MMEDVDALPMGQTSSDINWRVTLSVVALGMTSLVTQVIVLREFLSVFYGNELVIGVLLANWMLLTGLGSFLGRFIKRISNSIRFLILLQILLAIFPFVTVLLLRLLRNAVFPVGTMVGLLPILWSSFVLLIPYCVLSGSAFTVLVKLASREDGSGVIGEIYAREALGSVVGGLIFSLVLLFVLNTFQSLTALMAFNLAAALAAARDRPIARLAVLIVSLVLLVPSITMNVDAVTRRCLFPEQELVYSKDTPYSSLTVTRQSEQENFYENNVLLASTNDVTSSEESVHYAMVQHPAPKTVLMISGAISGAPKEVLKYGVERLDYVEVNPYLIDVARRYSTVLNDDRINVVNEDARLFVRETLRRYDVVLLNAPEPATLQVNRYYTVDFLDELKLKMNPGGVLSLGLLSSTDYQSEEARGINSTIMNTLRSFFNDVLIVPGLKTYFLASDSSLSIAIGKMIERRGINNTYVNRYYLDDRILAQRSELIRSSLFPDAPLNKDFTPVSYYRQVMHWLSYFETNLWIVVIIAALVLGFVATQLNLISAGILASGYAASSIEIVLLMAFQILYGYVYQVLGMIVTIFMAGLAVGSLFRGRILRRTSVTAYGWVQLSVALYCFLLPLVLLLLRTGAGFAILIHAVFFLLTFFIAVLIGLEFSLAAMLRQGQAQKVASELYSVDLLGSAIGALLVAAWLIPTLGVFRACYIAGSLSLLSGLAALFRGRWSQSPSA